jgi:hypothetical protein
MVDQFWGKVDLEDRDRTDFSQFTKIGEVFFPTSSPRMIPFPTSDRNSLLI